jgi:hypothetical protein
LAQDERPRIPDIDLVDLAAGLWLDLALDDRAEFVRRVGPEPVWDAICRAL